MTETVWTTIETPEGTMRLATDGRAIVAAEFVATAPEDPAGRADDDLLLREAARQFAAYFQGSLEDFDLPMSPRGTDFQQRVWEQLRQIPYGATTTYGAIAARLGLTGHAARAVGAANGRNPIAIAIPCHRVIGAGNKMVGYAGGLDRKVRLLHLENPALF